MGHSGKVVAAATDAVEHPAPMAQRGRPTSLTPEVQAKVCELIEAGLMLAQCAEGAGISHSTLNGWRARGRNGEEPYAAFLAATRASERKLELRLLAEMETSDRKWQLFVWKLQHRYPERYCAPIRYAERTAELRAEQRALERSRSKSKDAAIDPAEVAAYLRDHYPEVLRAAVASMPAEAEPKAEAH